MSKHKASILIVDDDKDVLYTAKLILKNRFEEIITESRPDQALSKFRKQPADIVLLDMNFAPGATSGNEGLFWLKEFLKQDPNVPVILNTAYGEIGVAVNGMKEGALDFMIKPWEPEKLLSTVENIYQLKKTKAKANKLEGQRNVLAKEIQSIVGTPVYASQKMKSLFETIEKVAPTEANVLILGENGVGKEVIARAIYQMSDRESQPFIKVDLGSISESLFESEMFGHVKGAFTDARENRAGRFEIADGGTLFLDEIGNLSPLLQSKLLTALQSQSISRVGSSHPFTFDVRIITATNQPVYEMVTNKLFRQDLLYRINTVEIEVPPLRERIEDIEVLTNYFLQKFSDKYGKELTCSQKLLHKLKSYKWPGNIRELEHSIERAVILTNNNTLLDEDFIFYQQEDSNQSNLGKSLKVGDMEKELIQQVLAKNRGNLSKAAIELGMGRSTLYRKMKRHGIDH